jgi:quercetin dioxygenase-like cupin family protein
MKIRPIEQVEEQQVEMDGAESVSVRWLLGQSEGTPNFAMRLFTVHPGGHTPRHAHPYEHEVYVLEGEGIVVEGDQEHLLRPGDAVLVEPDEVHQFRNTTDLPLRFLCLIPNSATQQQVTPSPECGTESE